jgi:hypothetical protein
LQFTIEARELARPRSAFDGQTIVEASDASDAITRYVKEQDAELVSITRPPSGGESIATVRKEDTILLVRVYAA